MTCNIITVECGGPGLITPEMGVYPPGVTRTIDHNDDNEISPCQCYQNALETEWLGKKLTTEDVLIYIHDDVTIHDPDWLHKVLIPFELDGILPPRTDGSEVVAVGLGGALSLGNKDLYRKPYDIRNMARGHYMSNQTDAQVHGERFTGCRRVAVLDAFLMAIRTEWLRSIGGWPVGKLTHHCMDLWLACEAARHNKEIWMTGCSVTHHGGGSSTKPIYKDAKWLQAGSMESDHILPHLWLYNEYRDVLPIEV